MFSVVIPLYNKQYSIKACLSSVFLQEFNDYEIIIINDGSTDDSLELVEEIIKNSDHDIKLINQKNQGVSVARNVGVENSKYDYICFLDADDSWEINFLNTYKKYIITYSDAALWISGYNINNEPPILYEKEGYIDRFFKESIYKTILHTSGVCVKKSVLNTIGGFPVGKKVGEDLYVWARIAENYKFCYIPYNLVNVIQENDFSRSGRDLVNPYILEYYVGSKSGLKNSDLKIYLMYIYFVHLKDVLNKKNYSAFFHRWKIGLKLFPIFSILILIPIFLPFDLLKRLKGNF